jgi:uncharacterized protein YjbI with pentapeptide repeats
MKNDSQLSLFVLGCAWSAGVVTLAVTVPAMSADQVQSQREWGTAKAWGTAVVIAALLIGGGLALWAQHSGDRPNADSDLGSALVGAAVVAFAIFVLERRFGTIAAQEARRQAMERRREAERQAEERGKEASRHHAQLLTAVRDDLPGVDLSGRRLDGFYLRAKKMQRAELTDCHLAGANLSRAMLTNAYMARAILDDAYARAASLAGADLTGASLRRVNLNGADLSGGTRLSRADLCDAALREADLRQADLSGALNGPSCDFTGACYDGRTTWPDDVDPVGAGAVRLEPGETWASEAASKAGDSSAD